MNKPLISKRERQKEKKEFVEAIMGMLRPKIVMPGYTDMEIPPDIQQHITLERFLLAKNQEKLATETETLWYLSTASFVMPLDRDWVEIMSYLCRKLILRQRQELPDFLKEPIILDELQERDLHRLRSWIYQKGMEAMRGKK